VKKLIVGKEAAEPERNNFDFIRLAMALLVVWSHSFSTHLGSEKTEWISLLLNGVYNAGNLAVMAFFVISGFLITQSYVRSRTLLRYIEKRVRRIYPGYMVATAICAFVLVPLFATDARIDALQVAKTIGLNLLLQNYFPPSNAFAQNPFPLAVNGSLWSIPFEFWCYIGVAVLGAMALATRRWFLVSFLVAVMLARIGLDLLGRKPGLGIIGIIFGWPYLWTVILPSFLLGMVAFAFRQELPRSRLLLIGLAAASILACHLNPHVANLLVAPTLAYGVFMFAFTDRVALHGVTRFGDFSYGTYLYAFPIQQMLQASVGRGLSLPAFIIVSFLLSLAAGVLSWHIVEKWFLPRRIARTGHQGGAGSSDHSAAQLCTGSNGGRGTANS